jgi:anaerobic ribonucleoside-triphosphate reductase
LRAETLETTAKMKGLTNGGSLSVIELGATQITPDALADLTRHLIEDQTFEFFTYNRTVSYCDNCHKTWFGTLHKCPSCGSMSALATFDRFTST